MHSYATIVDMGFMWWMRFPSAEDREKNDETHFTWRDYASKIFSSIMSRHIEASTIIFVNNPYDVAEFLKSEEHEKHKSNHYIYGSKNVHIRPIDDLPSKSNFTNFFMNKSNKIRLQEFLKIEFQQVKSFPEKTYIYSVQRECENLHTGSKMADFTCNHQKADAIIIFISHILHKHGFFNMIIIDAEDTDVIALSAYAARQSNPKLGIRKKKALLSVSLYALLILHQLLCRFMPLQQQIPRRTFSEEERRPLLRMYVRTLMKPKNYWKISASL